MKGRSRTESCFPSWVQSWPELSAYNMDPQRNAFLHSMLHALHGVGCWMWRGGALLNWRRLGQSCWWRSTLGLQGKSRYPYIHPYLRKCLFKRGSTQRHTHVESVLWEKWCKNKENVFLPRPRPRAHVFHQVFPKQHRFLITSCEQHIASECNTTDQLRWMLL